MTSRWDRWHKQQHYERNRERLIAEAAVKNQAKIKEGRRIRDEAKARPCADCGVQYDPWIMQFDHVRGEKLMDIGAMINRSLSIRKLVAEIAKCDVVCANCHADRTYKRSLVTRPAVEAPPDSEGVLF